MMSFDFFQPTKIHFGVGCLNDLGEIVSRYGKKCLLVTTKNSEASLAPMYSRVKKILSDTGIDVVHFDKVVPDPTIESIEEAIEIVHQKNIQIIVPVGGGSSIDTGKSIALFYCSKRINWNDVFCHYTDPFAEYAPIGKTPLPVIAVTTTSGTGAQLTHAMVISDPSENTKNCIFHDKVFARETIIDPELMLTLPGQMTAITGFDAFAHAFESYLSDAASPYTEMIALESMRIIVATLPKLLKDRSNLALRSKMAYADMLSGISLTNAAADIPHPLSEIIGGVTKKIPHGQCLAVVYPEYIKFIQGEKIQKCANISRILDSASGNLSDHRAAEELYNEMIKFLDSLELNKTLSELGCSSTELEQMSKNNLLEILPWASRDVLFRMIEKRF